MGRALLCAIAVSLCLVAGCGSSSTAKVTSPLATELSYFPAGSPFVATIATNPQGTAVQSGEGLLGAFPLSRLGITELESELSSIGLNYQTDIEPLYGNPVALGVLQVPGAASLSGSNFLAVWVTKSAAKLDALMKKLPGLNASGSYDGATLYRAGASSTFAVDGATAVFGVSKADVDAALDHHAHGGGISSADYTDAMGSLPQTSLVEAFGSLTGALSGPQSAMARKVPWVAAIRSYGASLSAGSSGITAQFRIDTSGGSLTAAGLPIATGTTPPELAGSFPITVGLRDPSQSLNFILAALQAADPTTYARFVKAESTARSKTGFDLQTFAALLTGNMVIASDTRTTMGRADVSNPVSAAKQLAVLGPLASYLGAPHGVTRVSGGFYSIKESGGKTLNLGLVGSQFVAGLATPAQLRAFAAAPSTPAGTQGSVAFRISLLDLLQIATKSPSSAIIQSVLSNLGDITGSASATTGALTGSLSLAVK